LRRDAALLRLELLVPLGGIRLSLQVVELLLDLVSQIGEALEVLPRMTNAVLGLAAPLLVLRDACRFLEKRAKLLRLRLDEPGNHPLLDDRIAVRAEPSAEENMRDVLAAAAAAVQEVLRGAIARDDATDRNLVVVRVRPRDRTIGVIEHELDARLTDRLAAAGAVEDHVGHRVAAQGLRRALAEHPPDRVDDVRLTAAVRADDADQIARKLDRRGVDERFETEIGRASCRERGEIWVGGVSGRKKNIDEK